MGTILTTTIINSVLKTLNDDPETGATDGARYTSTEILGYINDCQKDMVAIKPDVYTKNENVVMVSGTKQSSPGIGPPKLVRNMGADGATAGNAIRLIEDWDLFDLMNPGWHATTASATIEAYLFDENDPDHYYVYPPQPASGFGYAEVIYTDLPADCTYGGAITVDDVYVTTINLYCLYRAYAKDAADSIHSWERSAEYQKTYYNLLGRKDLAEKIAKPKRFQNG